MFLSQTKTLLVPFFLCAAVFLFYFNGVWAPFIFDDYSYIVQNPSIRHLWPLWKLVMPPHYYQGPEYAQAGQATMVYAGRPLINLSFALNYAWGGLQFLGYHLWNIAVHMAATLVLFGLVRRTLLLPPLRGRFGADAGSLAAAIALLWALHPLQTESVTYILQRAESMAGLFYLLTLYCFLRGAEAGRGRGWFFLSVLACLAGAGCKETIVTAPVMVLLYDRTFLAGTFKEAWRRRGKVYLSFLLSWLFLAYWTLDLATHGGVEGFGHRMGTTTYLPIQCWAIIHYLKLTFWPHPLILDYGAIGKASLRQIWPQAFLISALLAASAWGVWRRSPLGFLGAWFFIILAPSSSIVPIQTQTIAEHRIYLSLASVGALVALGGFLSIGRSNRFIYWVLIGGLIGELGLATLRRNWEYQDPVVLWKAAAAAAPHNPRIYYNLGSSYYLQNKPQEAMACFRQTIAIDWNYDVAHYSMGQLLASQGRYTEAVEELKNGLLLSPNNLDARAAIARILDLQHKPAEALPYCEGVLRLDPANPAAIFLKKRLEAELAAKKSP